MQSVLFGGTFQCLKEIKIAQSHIGNTGRINEVLSTESGSDTESCTSMGRLRILARNV